MLYVEFSCLECQRWALDSLKPPKNLLFVFGFVLLSKSLCRLLLKVRVAAKGKESCSISAANRLRENQLGFLSPSVFPCFSWAPVPTQFWGLGKLYEESRAHCPRDKAQSFLPYCSNDTLGREGNLGYHATTASAWVSFADSQSIWVFFFFIFYVTTPQRRGLRDVAVLREVGVHPSLGTHH